MQVGVLAFHGDFAEHLDVLRSMDVPAIEVRNLGQLAKVDRLIIPGGESTVMSKFLESTGVGEEIVRRSRISHHSSPPVGGRGKGEGGRPFVVYGTCAGAILVAKEVTGKNVPKPLGLIDITVERNAYGTQAQSFETRLKVKGVRSPINVAFIRAPIITRVGKGVEVLASHKGVPVLVRQGMVLAGTFHPEVRGNTKIHELFLNLR